MKRSVLAIIAGVVLTVLSTSLIDIAAHAVGVFPPMGEPLTDVTAAIALSYRIAIGILAGWLAARLAPQNPMKHAVVLGIVGTVLGLIGVVATWNAGLGPRWYALSLALLAIPQCWAGGKLHEIFSRRS